MAQVRRKPKDRRHAYDIGWWVNPACVDKETCYGWRDETPNWSDGELTFTLDSRNSCRLQVEVNVWDAHEWTDKSYAKGTPLGDIKIEVHATKPEELDEYLRLMDSSMYDALHLPRHRWFADDIYAGHESSWIVRHLNVDISDTEHPAYDTVWNMAQWLILRIRKQKTLFDTSN